MYHLHNTLVIRTIKKKVNPLILDFGKPDPKGEPIYLQIIKQFKLLVLQGKIKSGDDIPSRRIIAAHLGVNPNTVQKAFAELENYGLITTPKNAKSTVHTDENMLARLQAEIIEGQISTLVTSALGAGIDSGQLLAMVGSEYMHQANHNLS